MLIDTFPELLMAETQVVALADADIPIDGIQKLLQPLGQLQCSLQKMPEQFNKFR